VAEVKGLNKLLRTLEALPPELGSKGGGPIRRGLLAAAKEWRDSAAQRAPVGSGEGRGFQHEKHGNVKLRNSIIAVRDRAPQDEGFAERYFVSYSSKAWWGGFVEEGTVKQSAQPFLRPVADSEQNEAIRTFVDTFRRNLDRAVRRAKQ